MTAGTAYDINSANATPNHNQCGGFMFEIRAKKDIKISNLFYQHWSTSSSSVPTTAQLYRYHGNGTGCPGSIIGQNFTLNGVPYEASPSLWTKVGGSASGQSQTVAQANGFTCVFSTNASSHTFDTSTSTFSISNNTSAGQEARHICAGETATFYINGVGTRLAVGNLLSAPASYVSTSDMDIGWCARLHHGSISVGRWDVGDVVDNTITGSSPFGQPFITNSAYGFLNPNVTSNPALRTTGTFCDPSYLRVEATTMI